MAAVVTAYHAILGVDKLKFCLHRLVVGDALGIVTLHDSDYGLRQCHVIFLDDFKVADDVYLGRGSDERYAVKYIFGEYGVGHLYDTLCAELLAVEVVADGHVLVELLDSEYLYGLEQGR